MVRHGAWITASLGFCMKTDCIHHGDGLYCDKNCIRFSEYKTTTHTQLELFPEEGKKD